MHVSLVLAVALLGQAAPAPSAEPEMRVAIAGLDFTRHPDQVEFLRRVRDASRIFCDQHQALVTPDRLGDPAVCRAEMRRMAYRALPQRQRHDLASTRWFGAVR